MAVDDVRGVNVTADDVRGVNVTADDVREFDPTGLVLVCDHLDMTVWDLDDGRILRSGDRTATFEQAIRSFNLYETAFRATGVTPRPYEVVRIGQRYGVIVEYVRGFSLGFHLTIGSYSPVEAGELFGDISLRMHSIELREGYDMHALFVGMARCVAPHLPARHAERLIELVSAIPPRDTLLHGDIHAGNVIINRSGAHLIDMDTISFGHPVFDLAISEAHVYHGIAQKVVDLSIGIESATRSADTLWDATLRRYFLGRSEDEIARIAKRIEILALLTRCCGGPLYFEEDMEETERWISQHVETFEELLADTLPQVERLDF